MSAELSPVEMSVDHVLEGLDPHLDGIRDLMGKTDADFIDDEGRYSKALRAGNNEAISEAIDGFNKAAATKSFEEAVEEGALTPETLVALQYVFGRDVALEHWNHRAVGSSYERPLPELVESVEDLKPAFLETVEKVDEIVEWWRNGAAYFADEGAVDRDRGVYGATVYPANGDANVETNVGSGTYSRGNIVASFENGVQVGITEREGQPTWISIGKGDKVFKIPLLGYEGYHATTDDFMNERYEKYAFLGEGETGLKTDAGLFAARVALEVMTTDEDAKIEVPLPAEEYRDKIVNLLAGSTVAAFNRARLVAQVRHGGGRMSGYRVAGVDVYRANNLVRSSTEAELKAFLHGVGATTFDLSEATDTRLEAGRSSDNLGSRIDAIRTQSDIDEFLDTLG